MGAAKAPSLNDLVLHDYSKGGVSFVLTVTHSFGSLSLKQIFHLHNLWDRRYGQTQVRSADSKNRSTFASTA